MVSPGAAYTGITKILILSITLHSFLSVGLDPCISSFFPPLCLYPQLCALWCSFSNSRGSGQWEKEKKMLINGLFSISFLQIEWLNVITEMVARRLFAALLNNYLTIIILFLRAQCQIQCNLLFGLLSCCGDRDEGGDVVDNGVGSLSTGVNSWNENLAQQLPATWRSRHQQSC